MIIGIGITTLTGGAMTTTKEIYEIDEDDLINLAKDDAYWAKCQKFYSEVKNKSAQMLTERQVTWLEKIYDQVEEAKQRGRI